jgi:hypothetical protein
MPRWLWWMPLGVLLLCCAMVGLRYGWIAATITETDVITHYAQRYVNEARGNAALTDCAATGGDGLAGIWIVVRCRPQGIAQIYEYYVNGLGGLEYQADPREFVPSGPRT